MAVLFSNSFCGVHRRFVSDEVPVLPLHVAEAASKAGAVFSQLNSCLRGSPMVLNARVPLPRLCPALQLARS